MPSCFRCKRAKEYATRAARGDHSHYAVRCRSQYGAFNVEAAEMILRLAPRKPIKVSARSLDQYFRFHPWEITERHLRHVDNGKAGIMATLTHNGRRQLYLIEGFHRATNHRESRSDWSCYVLTPEESYAILTPLCYCRKGTK